jgi:hypothetical protein
MEEFLQVNVYSLSMDVATDRYGKWIRHLPGNINGGAPTVAQVQLLWPGITFTTIVMDYYRSPSAWATQMWSPKFYSASIPAFRDILAPVPLIRINIRIRFFLPIRAHACSSFHSISLKHFSS